MDEPSNFMVRPRLLAISPLFPHYIWPDVLETDSITVGPRNDHLATTSYHFTPSNRYHHIPRPSISRRRIGRNHCAEGTRIEMFYRTAQWDVCDRTKREVE